MNSRIAQTLRGLSLNASMESDVDASVTTGDGDQTVKVALEQPEQTPADGAGAPAEDKDLTTKTVEVDNGPDTESAETEVTGDETVSQEGLGGAVKAFGKTWGIGLRSFFTLKSATATSKAYGQLDIDQKRKADKLKQKIEVIAGRLAEFREGDRKKAVAEGTKIPESQLKPLDEDELIQAVIRGQMIPFYTTYYGHKVESLEDELNAKLAELSRLIQNVSTESFEEDLGPLLVSTEGFKGAFRAFGKTWGIALRNIFSDDGVIADSAKFSKLDVQQKREAEKLKQKIETISKRIADFRDGDRAAAQKAGIKIDANELKELSDEQILDAIVRGRMIPFYTTYYGHKVESLEKDLNAKLAELSSLLSGGVSNESDESDVTTGDGEQTVTVKLDEPEQTPADGAGAPGEDEDLSTKIVEVGERANNESAETTVKDAENVTVSQESLLAVAAIAGLIAAASGFSSYKAGKLKNDYIDLQKQIKIKRAQLDHLITATEAEAKLALRKARVSNESISEDLERLDKGKIGNTANAISAAIGGGMAGALFASSSPVAAVVSAGLASVVLLANIAMVRKAKADLAALEAKLADKELEIIKLADEAEKKGTKVSQESIDEVATELATQANAAAVAAAAGVAQGAAAAAEAAAAAVEAVTGQTNEGADEAADVAADAAADAADEVDSADDLKAIEDGHSEIESIEGDIADGEAHADEYEQASATMESLVDALQDAQRTGGMTPQAARFFNIGFESIGIRLTGAPFKNVHGESAIPSMESFGGTMRRDEATNVSMEAAGDWLKKILEVLKKTWAQVKEWVIKFIQAVFDQAARYDQRADKILAAVKGKNEKAKSATVDLGRSGAKIAVGNKVELADLSDLVKICEEAGVRSKAATDAIMGIRTHLKEAIAVMAKPEANRSEEETLNAAMAVLGITTAASNGELRSQLFNEGYKDEDGHEGFSTKLLPGNVRLAVINPTSEGSVFEMVSGLLKGWRVITVQESAPELGEVPTLATADIARVANDVKKVIAAARSAKDSLKAENIDLTNVAVGEDVEKAQAKQIQKFLAATGKSVSNASSSIGALLKYAVGTSGFYLDYAVASLKQYGAVIEGEAAPAKPALAASA